MVPSIVVEVTKLGAVAKCDFFEPVSHGGSSVVTSFPRTLTLYFFYLYYGKLSDISSYANF